MKTLKEFETLQPFATRFFTETLRHKHLVNAYILKSKDMFMAYRMVLRITQVINCSNNPLQSDSACGACQSCRWIEENAHPGVITLSNLTYLADVDPETGTSKNRKGRVQQSISVDQMKNLLRELSLHSSGFHRTVILTGATEAVIDENEVNKEFVPPKDWIPSREGMSFKLLPLDRDLFPATLANKFLKTLEEPPQDVMFFLLTDSEEKLLETIVSRCQSVPFTLSRQFYNFNVCEEDRHFFSRFLDEISGGNDLNRHMKMFTDFSSSRGLHSIDLLKNLQFFLRESIAQDGSSLRHFEFVRDSIKNIETAKTMIRDKVKEEAVLEDLFLYLESRIKL